MGDGPILSIIHTVSIDTMPNKSISVECEPTAP